MESKDTLTSDELKLLEEGRLNVPLRCLDCGQPITGIVRVTHYYQHGFAELFCQECAELSIAESETSSEILSRQILGYRNFSEGYSKLLFENTNNDGSVSYVVETLLTPSLGYNLVDRFACLEEAEAFLCLAFCLDVCVVKGRPTEEL